MISVATVALDGKVSGVLEPLAYLDTIGLRPGGIVLAPLGPRQVLGVVLDVTGVAEADLPVPLDKMRAVASSIADLQLPPQVIALARSIACEYLCTLPQALAATLPPGLRERLVTSWTLTGDSTPHPLTTTQQEVLKSITDLGGTLVSSSKAPLSAGVLRALRLLRGKGLVRDSLSLAARVERSSLPPILRLSAETERLESFLAQDGRRRPAQALTLMRLQGAEAATFSPNDIKALCGVTDQTIRALLAAALLEPVPETWTPTHIPTLNPAQQGAVATLSASMQRHEAREYLLFGVTGSGKTEVYLHAAAEALRLGRQVLFLVPEIALAAQVVGQLRARFGPRVALLHSGMSAKERGDAWVQIARGEIPIVLGARSALFAPIANLGLIVMDEEHEGSYKQESVPRYHAKSAARALAEAHGATLVLGSATPSVETFWEAQTGRVTQLDLPARAAATARLPEVHVVDLGAQFRPGSRPSMLSTDLREAIEERLRRAEQTILFLNRRAYSPYLGCRDCGHVFTCPNCAVSLSYHKRDQVLACHYCGHRVSVPLECPTCHGIRLHPTGAGTEKAEEFVKSEFPGARVARLDRDVTRRKGALEETLAAMRARDIDILVGTQMVAKGLDFPAVTLVGVILADTSLYMPDFRASERTFQLLSQVAGRAGRAHLPGEVFIQTFSPSHASVTLAQRHDFVNFYHRVLAEREGAGYPPFVRIVRVVFSGADRAEVAEVSEALGAAISLSLPEALVLGPTDCELERLQGQWRRHLIIKAPLGVGVSRVSEIARAADSGKVQLVLDADPYTML